MKRLQLGRRRCTWASAMAKRVSAAAINAMRMQWKKARTSPPATPADRNAARKVKRDAHKAAVLSWGVSWWESEAARLRAAHGPLCLVEFVIGMKPERYTPSLNDLYERSQSKTNY
jgi:hypothetical protein